MSAVTPKVKAHEQLPPLASRFVAAESIPWEKTVYEGVEVKTLIVDPATGLMTQLLRMAPGAKLPDHEHVLIEQTYVMQGSLVWERTPDDGFTSLYPAKGQALEPGSPVVTDMPFYTDLIDMFV